MPKIPFNEFIKRNDNAKFDKNQSLFNELWHLVKDSLSNTDYENMCDVFSKLDVPINLKLYIQIADYLASSIKTFLELDILVVDTKIRRSQTLLEQFVELSNLFLKQKSIAFEELKSIKLLAKDFPFTKCLIETVDDSLPDNVLKNIKLTTAVLFCAECFDGEWSNRIRKVKDNNNYKFNREKVVESLNAEITSLASFEEYLIGFDKPKASHESRSLIMFEDIQRFLFEYCLTEGEQLSHKHNCPLLFDEEAIFNREYSDYWTKNPVTPYFRKFTETHCLRAQKKTSKSNTIKLIPKAEIKVVIPTTTAIRNINHKQPTETKERTLNNPGNHLPKIVIESLVAPLVDDSFKAAEAFVLNGSRLKLIERLNIPWRTNLITEEEAKTLITFINSEMSSDDKLQKFNACIVYLTLLTSKSRREIEDIHILKQFKTINKDCIDISRGLWIRRDLELSNLKFNENQKVLLNDVNSYLALPLPKSLIKCLDSLTFTNKTLRKLFGAKTYYQSFDNFLKRFNSLSILNRNITEASIRAFTYSSLERRFDSSFAALLLSNSEYTEVTHLYYLSINQSELISAYTRALSDINVPVDKSFRNDLETYSGSKLSINLEQLSNYISQLYSEACAINLLAEKEIITSFNNISQYTVLMLVASTSHRPRTEFSFSDYSIEQEYCLIADKIHFDDSKIRIVPLPETVLEQIKSYRNFCRYVSLRVASLSPELAKILFDISISQSLGAPLFGVISEDFEFKPIGKQDLESYFFDGVGLPANCFRHALSSWLRTCKQGNKARALLGHINSGEHLLSHHSFCAPDYLTSLSVVLDEYLAKLGFNVVIVSPKKGQIGNVKRNDSYVKVYIPETLSSKTINNKKKLIKWARRHVQPFVKRLQSNLMNSDRIIQEIIDSAALNSVKDGHSLSETNNVLKYVNRFTNRLSSKRAKFTWDVLTYQSIWGTFNTDLLLKLKKKRVLKASILKFLKSDKLDGYSPFFIIALSLVVNTRKNIIFDSNFILAIKKGIFKSGNLFWLEIKVEEPLLIDSVTASFIIKYQNVISSHSFSAKIINKDFTKFKYKELKTEFDITLELSSINTLHSVFSECIEPELPSIIKSYRSSKIKTTDLPSSALTRLFLDSPVSVPPSLSSPKLDKVNKLTNPIASEFANINQSLLLIKAVTENLNVSTNPKPSNLSSKEFIWSIVIKCWQGVLGGSTTDLDELIDLSSNIDQTTQLVLIWILKVAERQGRTRKNIAVSTALTYFSKTAKPLLQINMGRAFVDLDEFEMEQFYCDVLEIKSAKQRVENAKILRDFHNTLQEDFNLPIVDWYYIEPRINTSESNVDANIISFNEYKSAYTLLENDLYTEPDKQRMQCIILILAYRLGLRRGEIKRLLLNDIDLENWIFHIKTNRFGRTKSVASNRRIPADLLLSDEEKKLISTQIDFARAVNNSKNLQIALFNEANGGLISFSPLVGRVMEALRIVSGDESIKLHHCRHSFANYLLIALVINHCDSALNLRLAEWLRCKLTSLEGYCEKLRETFTGSTDISIKILPALSVAMGHSDPLTTISNYIHCIGLLNWERNEIVIDSHFSISFLSTILNLNPANSRKILSRANVKKRKANYVLANAVERPIKGSTNFVSGVYTLINKELPEQKKTENLLLRTQFQFIDEVVKLLNLGYSREALHQCFNNKIDQVNQCLSNIEKVKSLTGYKGVSVGTCDLEFSSNNYLEEKVSKYWENSFVQSLVDALFAEYLVNSNLLSDIASEWMSIYDHRYGLLLKQNIDISKLMLLFDKVGLHLELSQEEKVKFGFKTEFVKKMKIKISPDHSSSINEKVNYVLFLVSVASIKS